MGPIRHPESEGRKSSLHLLAALKIGMIISVTVAVIISVADGLHFFLNPQYAEDMIKEAEQSLFTLEREAVR
jgi:Na+(H+)/acetate symporter ActP